MKNIQLVKRSEDLNRTFAEGKESENVTRVNYTIMLDGDEAGNVDVYPSSFNLNMYNSGNGTIAENTAIVEKMFRALKEE